MGVLSIKIRIGDREYPMKVDEREEELLRNAGRLLNEKLRTFKESYQIDDKQDLMAMVAFDCMVQHLKLSQEKQESEANISERIQKLSALITSFE